MEGALQMNIDDFVDVSLGHVLEAGLAQDAGVADQNVNPTESLDSVIIDRPAAGAGCHTIATGHSRAAICRNLGDDLVRSAISDVIDHHPRTEPCQFHDIGAAEAASSAGNDANPTVEPYCPITLVHRQFAPLAIAAMPHRALNAIAGGRHYALDQPNPRSQYLASR